MSPTNKLTSVKGFLYPTDTLSMGVCMILILGFVSLIKQKAILFNIVTKPDSTERTSKVTKTCICH